jgi:hypothetical protein
VAPNVPSSSFGKMPETVVQRRVPGYRANAARVARDAAARRMYCFMPDTGSMIVSAKKQAPRLESPPHLSLTLQGPRHHLSYCGSEKTSSS